VLGQGWKGRESREYYSRNGKEKYLPKWNYGDYSEKVRHQKAREKALQRVVNVGVRAVVKLG
jgi:hypothetical protein